MTQYSESLPASGGTAAAAKETAQTARDEAASVARTAAESGKDVAGSAAQSGRRLAHDAKDEAKGVAREAGRQTRDLAGQTREQLTAQAAEQQKRLAGGLRALGGELAVMADASDEPGVASDLVGQAATRADALAEWLDTREPGALLDEVKDFARQRPGTFLAIAAVAGLAAGRLTRGIKDDASSSSAGLAADVETPLYGNGPTGDTGDAGLGTELGAVPPPAPVPSEPEYGSTGYGSTGYGGPSHGSTGAGTVGAGAMGTTPPPAPPARQSVFPPVNPEPDPLTDPYATPSDDDAPPSYPPATGGLR